MRAEIVFDERVALTIIDDLLTKPIKRKGLANKPRRLVILPDGLSGYQLISYLLRKNGGEDLLDDMMITTFEDLAKKITSKTEIVDEELLRFIVTASVLDLTDPVSMKLKNVLSGVDEPEQSRAIDHLMQELNEYTGFVNPGASRSATLTTEITRHLAGLDTLLLARAQANLEFFRVLVDRCEKHLVELNIEDAYLTRAHMISDATSKLESASFQTLLESPAINELYILGVAIFDNTLLKFLATLVLNMKRVVIGLTPDIATRTRKRLSHRLSSVKGVVFKNEPAAAPTLPIESYTLPDRRREIEFTALKCIDLISPKSTSKTSSSEVLPEKILLVSRLAPDYRPYFEPVFNEFGLPAFMRTREALVFSPVYRFIESVLALIVKCERNDLVSAFDIAQPLRLGFPTRKRVKGRSSWAAIDDRRFLAIETDLEQRERYEGRATVRTWLKRLKERKQRSTPRQSYFLYNPTIELLEWLRRSASKAPDVRKLTNLLQRFIGVYGIEKDYPLLGLVSSARFEITNEHISSQANRVLTGLYQLVRHQERMSAARALLRGSKTSTSWSDTLKGYRGLVGGKTYGKVQRDSDAVLFVDAGISHFIDASDRFILGLNNDQFPRKQPEPFLLFRELRETLDKPHHGLFISSPTTQREIEYYLYVSAIGRADRVTLTMNYLDDRGHKQNWSVFKKGKATGEVLAHELRVELSKLHGMSTTPNKNTIIFSYLGNSRILNKIDVVADLTSAIDLSQLPEKWSEEIEAIASSTETMRERVIEGRFVPLLNLGPKESILEVFKKDRIPATWEIDLVTYCPAMYYFYVFYYLLPHKEWIINKGEVAEPLRYIPHYKHSFMGRAPLPLWRTHFSTRSMNWLESELQAQTRKITSKKKDALIEKANKLRVSPAEKTAIRILLSILADLPGGFRLKRAGLNSTKEFWRPTAMYPERGGFTILPFKLRPLAAFPYTHFQGIPYRVKHCSESGRRYEPFGTKKFPTDRKSAISGLSSRRGYQGLITQVDFKDIASSQKLCAECDYRSLCGVWGF